MTKRRASPATGNKLAILRLFQAEAEMPVATWTTLDPVLPSGISEVAEVARAAGEYYDADDSEPIELSARDIARDANLNYNSVRRDVRELVAAGLLTVDDDTHLYSLGEGDAEGTEGRVQEAWEAWVREAAIAAGWEKARLIEGATLIIRHSPGKFKSRKMPQAPRRRGGSGDPARPMMDMGGRELRLSPDAKAGRDIAVLATPMSSLEIIDVDAREVQGPVGKISLLYSPPPGAFAYAPTPKGYHFYRRWGRPLYPLQDWNFVRASRERDSLWHERLFDDDGAPREPPRPLPGASDKDVALTRWLWRLWRFFQADAAAQGYGNPIAPGPTEQREPGMEG